MCQQRFVADIHRTEKETRSQALPEAGTFVPATSSLRMGVHRHHRIP